MEHTYGIPHEKVLKQDPHSSGLMDIDQVGFLVKFKNEEIMRNITLMLTREQMISDITKAVEVRQSQALLESGGIFLHTVEHR